MRTNQHRQALLLGLSLLAVPLLAASEELAAKAAGYADGGAGEPDLLTDDEFEFSPTTEPKAVDNRWRGFKGTLQHTQSSSEMGALIQRSLIRAEYEGSVATGWFVHVDGRYQYVWDNDFLAKAEAGNGEAEGQWQGRLLQAWAQYTQGDCAVKLGKQNLIWGDVEGAFVVDVVSPFDYTEQLLTDFSSIRRAQNMAALDCFARQSMWQAFYNPHAQLDRFPASSAMSSPSTGAEYGLKYKYRFTGWDVTAMVARLYTNTPVYQPISNHNSAEFGRLAVANYYMGALSSSIAVGRVLYKLELAYKTDQLVNGTTETTDRLDGAAGIEYTSPDNHRLNVGVWGRMMLDDISLETDESPIVTAGWSKSYLHDELAMSLLANYAESPSYLGITLQGDYQWNDYLNTLVAVGWADFEEDSQQIPFLQAEKTATFSVKVVF